MNNYTITNYFNEFICRIFYLILSFILLSFTLYIYSNEILYLIFYNINNVINIKLISIHISEIFYTTIFLSCIISLFILIPIIIFQIILFFIPGLYKYEFKKILFYYLSFIIFYYCSLFVSHTELIPYICKYLLTTNTSLFHYGNKIEFLAKYYEFIIFIININLILIILSILPLILYYFLLNNIINNYISLNRNYIYFLVSLSVIFITPPDIYSYIFTIILFCSVIEFIIFVTIFSFYSKKMYIL